LLVLSMVGTAAAQTVTIEYWQYFFDSKVQLMDTLIEEFEAQNPGIKVEHVTFPYAQFNEHVAASVPAGTGPDVINLYYGWLPLYKESGYLQPLPKEYFPNEQVEADFLPLISAVKMGDDYWALPTAVRALALFYNEDHFAKAGYTEPPKTWDELLEMAIALTERSNRGALSQSGYAWNVTGQDWHLFREVLLRQWGVTPFSADHSEVLWNSDPGAYEVLEWWVNWSKEHGVGEEKFLETYRNAFLAGRASMMVDGSFALGQLVANPNLNWGVTELPVRELGGVKANFASFWAHGITRNATGAKLEASAKFLEFITSKETQLRWLDAVGELPASRELVQDEELRNHPLYGPFIAGLEYSHTTFFVDETGERDILIEMVDRMLLEDLSAKDALDKAVEDTQKIRAPFFEN